MPFQLFSFNLYDDELSWTAMSSIFQVISDTVLSYNHSMYNVQCTVPLWLFGDVYRPTVWEWFPIKTCYFRNWIDACRTFYVWKSITMCIIYIPDIMKILAKVVTFILASIVYFIYSLFLFLFPLISADFLVHKWRTPPIFCMSSLPFLNVQNMKFHCHRPIIKEFPHIPQC